MSKGRRTRLDTRLVELGIVTSIKAARALIMSGKVIVDEQRAENADLRVEACSNIRIKSRKKFVSRGADKIIAAIEHFQIRGLFEQSKVLDVGSSTGGFTDACLHMGAAHVTAVDVGTNQLAWKLRSDPRVTSFEKTDIRNFTPPEGSAHYDFVVCDLSFISLATILPSLVNVSCNPATLYLLLVKPQFEVEKSSIPKGGIISDESSRIDSIRRIIRILQEHSLVPSHPFDCPIEGRGGNREAFVLCCRIGSAIHLQ